MVKSLLLSDLRQANRLCIETTNGLHIEFGVERIILSSHSSRSIRSNYFNGPYCQWHAKTFLEATVQLVKTQEPCGLVVHSQALVKFALLGENSEDDWPNSVNTHAGDNQISRHCWAQVEQGLGSSYFKVRSVKRKRH